MVLTRLRLFEDQSRGVCWQVVSDSSNYKESARTLTHERLDTIASFRYRRSSMRG